MIHVDTNTSGRNLSIDLVKIVAMLGVISLHSNLGRTDILSAFVLSRIAGISIPLFFMTSGYLLLKRDIDWSYSIIKIYRILKFVFIISVFYLLGTFWFVDYSIKDIIYIYIGAFVQKGPFWQFWYFGSMIIIYCFLPKLSLFLKQSNNIYALIFFLLGFLFIIFMLNLKFELEKKYVLQTFRIWNWFFYFVLGGVADRFVNKEKIPFFLYLSVLYCMLFVIHIYLLNSEMDGVEFYFGSPLCVLYASFLFILILNLQIKQSIVISTLSNLFLPCYTLHFFIIEFLSRTIDTSFMGFWSPVFDYLMSVFASLVICFFIMRFKIGRSIFRI